METLLGAAKSAMDNAVCPISNFRVGAAVETVGGRVYSGCNIESLTLSGTTHAEINAIDSAIAQGAKKFKRLLVVTNTPDPIFPCALCRQRIIEFGDDIEVIASTLSGKQLVRKIADLYPYPFTFDATGITPGNN